MIKKSPPMTLKRTLELLQLQYPRRRRRTMKLHQLYCLHHCHHHCPSNEIIKEKTEKMINFLLRNIAIILSMKNYFQDLCTRIWGVNISSSTIRRRGGGQRSSISDFIVFIIVIIIVLRIKKFCKKRGKKWTIYSETLASFSMK